MSTLEPDLAYPEVVDPAQCTVHRALAAALARWPDATAVIDEAGELSYAELAGAAAHDAGAFAAAGLVTGDRILLMLPSSARYVSVWLGCMLAGLVEVPVNTDYTGQMLGHIIRDSRARAMVTTSAFATRLRPESFPDLEVIFLVDGKCAQSSPWCRLPDLQPEVGQPGAFPVPVTTAADPIGVLYTSGTTGPAKGAVISHRQAYGYAERVASLIGLGPRDVYYGPLPLFHIAGQWAVVYAALLHGATAHIRERFSVSQFWPDCMRSGATVTYLLGTMAQLVMRHGVERPPDSRLGRMLMIPLVPELAKFRERFGVEVTTCYGSTEAGVPLIADFSVTDPTAIGRIAPGYDLRVVDDDGHDVSPATIGELLVRNQEQSMLFRGYFGNPEATATAMRDGWFHSGDLVRAEMDGTYHFVDRKKDALRRRGENISSFEVEREVYAHPLVQECAAIGVPSDLTEDDLVVYVVAPLARAGFVDELADFLRDHAPRFMWPDTIVCVDEIPKTPTGKIAKQALRAMYGRTAGGDAG